jgi:hypothetical protein
MAGKKNPTDLSNGMESNMVMKLLMFGINFMHNMLNTISLF